MAEGVPIYVYQSTPPTWTRCPTSPTSSSVWRPFWCRDKRASFPQRCWRWWGRSRSIVVSAFVRRRYAGLGRAVIGTTKSGHGKKWEQLDGKSSTSWSAWYSLCKVAKKMAPQDATVKTIGEQSRTWRGCIGTLCNARRSNVMYLFDKYTRAWMNENSLNERRSDAIADSIQRVLW